MAKKKYSVIEKVFSVKNSANKKHKVITVLGISAKIRHFDYKPLITVIVPNYNHSPYLKERLDSIYNQSYKNFEVILLDDCSTDNSVEILKKYQAQHKKNTTLVENEKNSGGVFHQWKKGLELAKGDLIWIAESDDWCDKNFLAELINYFKDDSVMIAYGKSHFMNEKEKKYSINRYLKALKFDFDKPFIENAYSIVNKGFGYFNIIPNVSSAIFRNTGFKSIINNDEWYNLKLCGDWLFYLDLIKGGKIAYNPAAVNYYRMHNSNTSKKVFVSQELYKEHKYIAEYIYANLKANSKIYEKLNRRMVKWLKKNSEIKTKEELQKIYSVDDFTTNSKRKLNILIVSHKDSEQIANQLKAYGHSVTYYVSDKTAAKRPDTLQKSIPCLFKKDISIYKVLKNFGIDIVHTGDLGNDWETVTRVIPRDCRHVVTINDYNSAENIKSKLPLLVRSVSGWFYKTDEDILPFKNSYFHIDNRFIRYTDNDTFDSFVQMLEKQYYTALQPVFSEKEIYVAGAMGSAPYRTVEKLYNRELWDSVGFNTGNLIIGDFSRELLNFRRHKNSPAFPFAFAKDLDYINNNCERVVILATNWIAEYIAPHDFTVCNEVMDKIKVPVTILGLGSNLTLDELNKEYMQDFVKNINPSFVRFLHLCAEKSHSISVRGYITQELLNYMGIKNVNVTGCPTWYVNKENNIKIDKPALTKESVVLTHGNGSLKNYYKRIEEIVKEYPNRKFLIQSEFNELKYLNKHNLKKYPNNMGMPASFFKRDWGVCFADINQWSGYVAENVDLSFGFRIHGTIITLKNGKPAIIIANDSRTKEMSEFYNIPRVYLKDIDNPAFSLEEVYEKADFSILNKQYDDKYENFKNFLKDNGITD